MARIGRNITFNGSRETISDKMLFAISKLRLRNINFSFVNDNTINIYGDSADLITLRNAIVSKGFKFINNGAAPAEPAPPAPDPPIDWQPATLRQAFENMKEQDRVAFWNRVLTEYAKLGGTGSPPRVDMKWLR